MASYQAVIDIGVIGSQQVERVLSKVEHLRSALEKISKVPLAIDDKRASDTFRQLANSALEFARGLSTADKQLANTTAGLRQQAGALQQLAANSKIGGAAFNTLSQAAEQARQKLSLAGLAEIKAVNTLYKQGRTAPMQSFKGIEELLSLGKDIPKNTASLSLYKAELERVIDIVDYGTLEYQRLSRAIAETNRQMDIGRGIGPMQGPGAQMGVAGTQQRRNGVAGSLRSGKLQGIVENAVIGGAFPLLFGQGAGAATGGAIGGLVGGAFGGAGGFAGSLLGTLIGDIASQGAKIKELGADIGFSAEQTKQLQAAFKLAGADAEKFTASVQNIRGIGLAIEDQAKAIQLVSTLAQQSGGNIVKITNAVTSSLEAGKVTQATLNQLTSENIKIQDALAAKYKVSRSELLSMAKDGKISVQTLIDTLVDLGNSGVSSINKPLSTMQKLQQSFSNLGSAVAALGAAFVKTFGPVFTWLTDRVTDFVNAVARAIARLSDLTAAGRMIQIDVKATEAATRATQKKFGPFGSIRAFNPEAEKFFQQERQRQVKMLAPGAVASAATEKRPTLKSFAAPAQAEGKGEKQKRDKSSADAAREAERVAKLIRDRQAETQLLSIQAGLQDRIFQAEQQKDTLTSARLKGELDILNIQFQYAQELANETDTRVQQANSAKGLQEIENARLKTAQTLEEIEANRTEKYTEIIADLEYEKQIQDATTEQAKERLRIEYEMRKLQKENIYSPDQLSAIKAGKEALVQTPAQKRMKELETSIASLTSMETVGVMAADNIGMAFGQAFQDIATGSVSAQEALGNMMKSIGENFVNMAAQIIAQQTTMIILGAIMKALGLTMGGGGGESFPSADVSLAKYAPLTPFAEGGFVTKPTNATVGEGGQPEYIIPASKMQAAMSRYASGARGSSVIPDAGSTGTSTDMSSPEGGGMSTGPIDVRYSVERINSVDYVTADQFQRGISQAAQQGAQQGEQRTLRRLQQSRSTRSRLGMV